MAKKVILDVDTGSDDAVAIMTALLSDDIDLLGVTVTHGNQPLPITLENTLRLTPGRDLPGGEVGRSTVTVNGKIYSLHEENMGLPPTNLKEQDMPAAIWIVDTIKNSPE